MLIAHNKFNENMGYLYCKICKCIDKHVKICFSLTIQRFYPFKHLHFSVYSEKLFSENSTKAIFRNRKCFSCIFIIYSIC